MFVKNSNTISKQEKKITKISKDLEKRDMMIAEKDKEIKLYQIKLREFLQKNMRDLPLNTFDEIENIMAPQHEDSRKRGMLSLSPQ